MADTAKIFKCSCSHDGQDSLHGKGLRLFNKTQGKGTLDYFRCTVCSKEISTAKEGK